MSDRPHDEWSDDLAAFALGALSTADTGRVEAHLAECERCQAELRWLGPAVEVLPLAVEQRQPPARVRRRLLKTVRSEMPRPTAARRPAALVTRPALAVGLALIIGVAGVLGFALRGPGLEQTTTAFEASNAAPPGAGGDLVRYDGSGRLALSNLPALHGDDVYQAWLRRGNVIEPSSVFVPAVDGSASAGIVELDGADELMITREPDGGSLRPSTAPILRVSLS